MWELGYRSLGKCVKLKTLFLHQNQPDGRVDLGPGRDGGQHHGGQGGAHKPLDRSSHGPPPLRTSIGRAEQAQGSGLRQGVPLRAPGASHTMRNPLRPKSKLFDDTGS